MTRLPNAVPKPESAPPKARQFSSIRSPSLSEIQQAQQRAQAKRKPIKKKKRKPSEFARIYGSRERVAWMKRRPCIVANEYCQGGIDGHHIKTDGTGRKADARFIVPICHGHHRAIHTLGRNSFESAYNVHLETAAAQTQLAWQSEHADSTKNDARARNVSGMYSMSDPNTDADMNHDPELVKDILPRVIAQITVRQNGETTKQVVVVQTRESAP